MASGKGSGMRVATVILILGLVLAAAATAKEPPSFRGAAGEFIPAAEPRPAPTVTFEDGSAKTLGLDAFRGKLVVLNFWATWCVPCIKEMPSLDRLRQKLAKENAVVVALSSDRGGARVVEPFLKKHGVEGLGLWLDPKGQAARSFGLRGLPTTVLIGWDGRELGRLEGDAEWDSDAALALIRHYLR